MWEVTSPKWHVCTEREMRAVVIVIGPCDTEAPGIVTWTPCRVLPVNVEINARSLPVIFPLNPVL